MAVTILSGTIHLLYSPGFVASCTVDQLAGVLLHETLHVVFGHLLMKAEDYPDSEALLFAQEVTVNEYVDLPLPGEPITLDQYPQLPPDEDTKTRYDRLSKFSGQQGVPIECSCDGGEDVDERDGKPGPVDDHTQWKASDDSPLMSRAAIEHLIRQATRSLSEEDLEHLTADDRSLIEVVIPSEIAGTTALGAPRELGSGTASVDWRQVLRRFVGDASTLEAVFTRPSRRLPDLVGVVPGTRRLPNRPKLLAVIDTSGSMTGPLLEAIGAELKSLAPDVREVTVVECDAEIHRVYRFEEELRSVCGGGGTDLCPPFERDFLREHRPDLIVYFTDGYGPAPERAPRIPVLWALTPAGQKPAAWGRAVKMTEGTELPFARMPAQLGPGIAGKGAPHGCSAGPNPPCLGPNHGRGDR